MEFNASCTWGDGPDVLLKINDKLYDLNSKQATELSIQLITAAQQAEEMEEMKNFTDNTGELNEF